jgi:hypothetical protein
MPSRHLVAAVVMALTLAGCGEESNGSGRLQVERVTKGSGRLLDVPALASYCPAESLLTVIAVGPVWSGGLALRVTLPVRAPVTVQVRRTLDSLGSATAAFRPVGGVARFGVSGTVTLRPSSAIDAVFQVSVTDSAGPNAVFRGRLSNVAYSTEPGPPCRP